jgi:hypothetical protein
LISGGIKSSTFLEIFRSDVESFISEDSGANVSCIIGVSFELPNSSSSSLFSLALKIILSDYFCYISHAEVDLFGKERVSTIPSSSKEIRLLESIDLPVVCVESISLKINI